MKRFAGIILIILKWILILLIVLFSIATFAGKSYLQSGLLWLAIILLAWWPSIFSRRLNVVASAIIRAGLVVGLLLVSFVVFKPDPKSSIYISEPLEEELMAIYDEKVRDWPEGTEDVLVETEYGTVHVLACGTPGMPSLVMLHAASMGAHSWAENLEPLLDHFMIYSIDNIGEGNKSRLVDALVYPNNQKEIAEHLASVLEGLEVDRAILFGASNGGFVAMSFALYFPERVTSLALFGPMGLTQLTGKSIMMLSIATMYPFQFVRDRVTRWAIGEDPYVLEKYGDWFNCIMKATIPSVAMPVPLTVEQRSEFGIPVLLFLGTKDPIVGDGGAARNLAEQFPDIRIEIYESGHLISVEKKEEVNSVVREWLMGPGVQSSIMER